MKKNGFAPLVIILVIAILGVVGYFIYRGFSLPSPAKSQSPLPTVNSNPNTNKNNLDTNSTSCDIAWVNPVLPADGKIEPLFLKEAKINIGHKYEAIVRRKVIEGGYVSVDVVTYGLPVDNSPYYLYAVAVDVAKNICTQSNLGPLEKIPSVNSWGAGPFTLPVQNVNDAQLFVITEKGFGAKSSDQIKSLNDTSIILLGSYEANH
jgi:hypothetical protein